MKTIDRATPIVDEVIVELRRRKLAIMAEHGDDIDALLLDLRERQKANPCLVAASCQPPQTVPLPSGPAGRESGFAKPLSLWRHFHIILRLRMSHLPGHARGLPCGCQFDRLPV